MNAISPSHSEASRPRKTQPRFPENLPAGWRDRLKDVPEEEYFKELIQFLKNEYRDKRTIFPARDRIMRALQLVDFDDVRVVILGQDPYHGVGQAVGLCFAVPNSLRTKPPSLLNIFKEIESDLRFKVDPNESELTGWARQGVLLLNTVLTVRQAQAFSHREKGWETFTDKIIQLLNEREEPVIFLLWGAAAQAKKSMINRSKHFVLEAAHPSPLSAHKGFFGCKHFSKVNEILEKKLRRESIRWNEIL